ncbi:hypothetical protein BDW59DRAFT_146427 [Aspergillus cavernicola]|uniref:DUF4371 domain-containing protein n=1 Tax=Aspergillus cavernicola TaxID=176166 RepID=A0ABR4ICI4_9EURO
MLIEGNIDPPGGLEPAFRPPDRRAFGNKILDLCYSETKSQVEEILGRTRTINLIVDESSNISRDRIMNLCVNTSSAGQLSALSTFRLKK